MAAILVYGTGISSFLFKYFVLFHHPAGATDHVSENDLYCFALLRLWLLIDEQSEYAKKLQGRCELSGGQRLASSVYFVYCPSAKPG
jgi:hypothetical protein